MNSDSANSGTASSNADSAPFNTATGTPAIGNAATGTPAIDNAATDNTATAQRSNSSTYDTSAANSNRNNIASSNGASISSPPSQAAAAESATVPRPTPGKAVLPAGATSSAAVGRAVPAASASGSAPPSDDVADAKKRVRLLINRGQMREAIPAAERAIALEPADAEMYLLLGAALQETGQWARARATFSRCVSDAKYGPKGECRALGDR